MTRPNEFPTNAGAEKDWTPEVGLPHRFTTHPDTGAPVPPRNPKTLARILGRSPKKVLGPDVLGPDIQEGSRFITQDEFNRATSADIQDEVELEWAYYEEEGADGAIGNWGDVSWGQGEWTAENEPGLLVEGMTPVKYVAANRILLLEQDEETALLTEKDRRAVERTREFVQDHGSVQTVGAIFNPEKGITIQIAKSPTLITEDGDIVLDAVTSERRIKPRIDHQDLKKRQGDEEDQSWRMGHPLRGQRSVALASVGRDEVDTTLNPSFSTIDRGTVYVSADPDSGLISGRPRRVISARDARRFKTVSLDAFRAERVAANDVMEQEEAFEAGNTARDHRE